MKKLAELVIVNQPAPISHSNGERNCYLNWTPDSFQYFTTSVAKSNDTSNITSFWAIFWYGDYSLLSQYPIVSACLYTLASTCMYQLVGKRSMGSNLSCSKVCVLWNVILFMLIPTTCCSPCQMSRFCCPPLASDSVFTCSFHIYSFFPLQVAKLSCNFSKEI